VAFPRNDGKLSAYSANRTDVPRPMEIRNILIPANIERIETSTKIKKKLKK
jgi:hypothetical protein